MTTSTPALVSEPELAELAVAHGEELEVPRDHVIFAQRNLGDRLYIVRAGKVKSTMDGPGNWVSLLAIHGPSEVFGAPSMFDLDPRSSTAIAVTDVRVISIRHSAVRERISDRPHLAEHMLRSMARQIRRSNAHRADLIFTDVPGRAAKTLLQLARRFGIPEGAVNELDHFLVQRPHLGADHQLNKLVQSAHQSPVAIVTRINERIAAWTHRGTRSTRIAQLKEEFDHAGAQLMDRPASFLPVAQQSHMWVTRSATRVRLTS